jgi:hypothetical protein
MVNAFRSAFNASFTEKKYREYLDDLDRKHPGEIEFRVAETPIFIDKVFKQKMLDACEHIVDVIQQSNFKELTERAIPKEYYTPNENDFSHFIAFDFGICRNDKGELEPQLIEMQGFPTLFAYQILQADMIRKHFVIPDNYSNYLSGYTKERYLHLLKDILLQKEKPENVILLELFPHKQKTRIDFYCTEEYTGVKAVCLTEVILKGNELYYEKNGEEIKINRIYNRLIFDELNQQPEHIQQKAKDVFTKANVDWVPHPNWFYRISKFTLPYLNHPYIPETRFLNEIENIPNDLQNYVLKPLFSFAGQGVIIDVTSEDIEAVKDKENWILQRKVNYADIIETPDGGAKAEIRLFYFQPDGEKRPVAVHNLARLSKGKMIGVRYNADKIWVGGTICFFEED